MDYSFVVIDSVESFNKYKTEFLRLDAEYHFWNLSTSKDFFPNYVADFKESFGDDLETVLKELKVAKETGTLTEKLNEIYTSSYERGFVTVLLKYGVEIVGQMGLSSKESAIGVLVAVYVKPSRRRRNFASFLLEKIKIIAREKGLSKIKLVTFPFMIEAIKFYANNGFHTCDYFTEINQSLEVCQKFDSIFMELEL